VTVEASAQGLSTEDASLGAVINNNTVSDTPLYLRNWDDLLRLVPACNPTGTRTRAALRARGARALSTCTESIRCKTIFILDGIDNNTFSENVQELSTQAGHPSVETIQEFKVITNPYSAEYGRSPGAAVSVTTKSGSNQFHGTAYEYGRNQLFDANDFFSNKQRIDNRKTIKTSSAGAWAPRLFMTGFSLFHYEGTRIKKGVNRVSTVPLPNERSAILAMPRRTRREFHTMRR